MNRDMLFKYFRGYASPEEQNEIISWIDSSKENYETFKRERLFFDVMLFSKENVKHKSFNRKYVFNAIKWTTAVAACVLFIIGANFYLNNNILNKLSKEQIVNVPAGQRVHLTLSDGTSVWLNSSSTFKYNSNFGIKSRDVTLDGEAYFEVAKNKDIPFDIYTDNKKIRVVGTTFNVSAYHGTNVFETSLLEGIIDIYSIATGNKLVRLEKNENFISRDGNNIKGKINSKEFLRWKEGIYSFDDLPMSEVLRKLELYYNVKIKTSNNAILNYHCTGKFKEQDGVEHIIKVLQKDLNFDYQINEDRSEITLK